MSRKVSLPGPDRPWQQGVPAFLRLRAGRRPPHPGHFLESRFLVPLGITQDALARALGISRRRVNELVRGKRAVTPDTAVRLALLFQLEPAFWLGLQLQWDLYRECRAVGCGPSSITGFATSGG
ncbi:HigA family addiction module antitoxin [Zoogloea sp. LCSB751]|uniref:HigA family addiction module antitoxin n=1 Tax=Zoogloea sp. LCSB751 TaxID=1965277 RepID=UPI0009A50296|nr:HigA family addiction module antitoxin [Zoogloea sp. LCSB751]